MEERGPKEGKAEKRERRGAGRLSQQPRRECLMGDGEIEERGVIRTRAR